MENEQQSEDVATVSTQELARSAESKNGKQAEDVAELSTQELAHGEKTEAVNNGDAAAKNGHQAEDVAELSTQEFVQAGERPEDVAELSTQELAQAEEREQAEGKAPEALEAEETVEGESMPSEPLGLNEADKAQLQEEFPRTSDDAVGEGDDAQVEAASAGIIPPFPSSPQQFPISPAPKARRGSATRWIIIAVVGLLVLAGIAGGLLFWLRPPGLLSLITPGIGTSPTSGNTTGVTPIDTTCPTGSCITRITGTTPVAGTNAVFLINFSGAVRGSMAVTSIARCGPSTEGTEYDLYFSGTVDGVQYNFVARIPTYKGPASYNQISVVFAQQPMSSTTIWGNSGNAPAQAIINGDVKSGTMDITLDGAANTVHVSGYWICA